VQALKSTQPGQEGGKSPTNGHRALLSFSIVLVARHETASPPCRHKHDRCTAPANKHAVSIAAVRLSHVFLASKRHERDPGKHECVNSESLSVLIKHSPSNPLNVPSGLRGVMMLAAVGNALRRIAMSKDSGRRLMRMSFEACCVLPLCPRPAATAPGALPDPADVDLSFLNPRQAESMSNRRAQSPMRGSGSAVSWAAVSLLMVTNDCSCVYLNSYS
jgi:hypothetical protein